MVVNRQEGRFAVRCLDIYSPRDAQRDEESKEDGLSCGLKKLPSR